MTRIRLGWLNAVTFMHGTLTCMMAAMAIQLALPTSTYGAGGLEPTGNWRLIARYVDERELAALLWMVACVGVLGLATKARWLRLTSAVVLGLGHGILAAFFLWSNPSGIGSLLLAGYAIQGAFLAFRRTTETA